MFFVHSRGPAGPPRAQQGFLYNIFFLGDSLCTRVALGDINTEISTKIIPVRAVNFSIGPFCTEFRCERSLTPSQQWVTPADCTIQKPAESVGRHQRDVCTLETLNQGRGLAEEYLTSANVLVTTTLFGIGINFWS